MVSMDKSVAMTGFFDEVKRRKVYRVAAAYIIAAGGIIQLASAAFPAWELPNWALRLVIVLLLMGFPIALILAWAYDITAQGVRATPTTGIPRSHRRRNIVMLVVTGVIISAAAGFFLLPRVSAHKCDKSIAVLPFENLSDEKENAYFADGIQDDVLTNLSKIGDLKVISRTSVMPYRGKGSNVREIGKTLGVGAILTDLAQQIVRELQAKLSPMEKAQIERRPTENGEAYLAFMQGHEMFYRPDKFRSNTETAEQLFEKATKLDPNFAGAFAALARVHEWSYRDFDPTPARKEKARVAADTAIRLQPDLPEAHLAMGFYYWPLVRLSVVKANGRSPPRIWREPHRSVQRTPGFCKILLTIITQTEISKLRRRSSIVRSRLHPSHWVRARRRRSLRLIGREILA